MTKSREHAARSLAAGLIVALAGACAVAEDLLPLGHIVVFNNNGRKPPSETVYPLFRLSERFTLVEDFYTPRNLDATIAENLRRSRMLYVGQYSDESPLWIDPDLRDAICAHLTGGGLLVFDYGSGGRGVRFQPETKAFLKSVKVTPPGEFQTGYGTSRFLAAETHAILARPVPLGGKTAGHYGWWQRWGDGQIVLACDRDDKGRATVILQERVLGKGTVLFSQLPSAFRDSSGTCFDFVRNIVTHAYGPLFFRGPYGEGRPTP